MASFPERKSSRGSNLHLENVLAVALVILTFVFCLLVYAGMMSTSKSLDLLAGSPGVSSAPLAELKQNYHRQQILDLILILMSASMGVTLLIIWRYLRRTTVALKEVESIDHDILNSITRGIATVDLQGRITSCNRALEEIIGVREEDLLDRSLEEVFSVEDPLCQLLQESIQREESAQDVDLAYTSRAGRIMPLRVTTFALKNEMGKRIGGILLVKDMTEIRKMEEIIQRASRLAALGELTQRLVHEIRNPLSAMDLNLQLLQERLDVSSGDAEIGRYLSTISTETRRLNEALRKAQLFSQPEPPDLEPVDLHEVIRQVLFLIKEEASQRGVEIRDSLLAQRSLVLADTDQMKQVFINLFKNSIEAMTGGGRLEVLSRNGSDGKVIGVELVDSGSGIPLPKLQRVFDPYFTTKRKGSGLGLSIVHNIITQHGGNIDVTSWLGEGTIFSIILPVASSQEADNGNEQAKNSDRG